MRVKSSFIFTIAACNSFWFLSSVPASTSALRSLPSSICRIRSPTFGLLFGGGPAPAGFPWPRVVAAMQRENSTATRSRATLVRLTSRQFIENLLLLVGAHSHQGDNETETWLLD